MRSFIYFLSLAAVSAAFLVAGPSGPHAVAYNTAVLTDDHRQDPYAPTPQKRRVPISVYLPVDVSRKPCPKQTLPYMTPAVAAHYGQLAAQIGLANDTFAKFDMEYCNLQKLCSKKTRGSFPLVLYDTGLGPARGLYGAKARDVASQGYVVVTVDHPYDAGIVEYPDGSVVESIPFNDTEAEVVNFLKVRGQDLSFVLAQLQNSGVRTKILAHYTSTIDFSRVVSIGHSLGGVASELIANTESLIRGAVNMDGGIHEPVSSTGVDKPTMQFGRAGHDQTDPSWDALWPLLRGPAAELALANATHGTFTDVLTLLGPFMASLPPEVVQGLQQEYGSIDPKEAQKSIVGGLVAGFEFVFDGRTQGIDEIHQHYSNLNLRAAMIPPNVGITPEKEGSILNFISRQWKIVPEPVTDVDLTGKTAVIVGANCGVGLEVARQFLELGLGTLIIGARNEERSNIAMEDLRGTCGDKASIETWPIDLASYDSIVSFAERANSLHRMDFVVLNAGMCATTFKINESTRHDETTQINYLSLALTAALLLPVAKMKRATQGDPTRVTFTSSDVASWTTFKERSSVPLLPALDSGAADLTDRMMVSKLLGQFYIAELVQRIPSSVVTINCATPGMVYGTQFNREVDKTFGGKLVKPILRYLGYRPHVGARNITDAALRHDNAATHGQYLSAQRLKPMAPIIYTEEGSRISVQLWKETMAEFAFAKVEQIIDQVRKE
ncbi:hypothetical protein PWT90_08399 [Aphanocladium album]|nr:hypothetical protein PWT90_08399 [Aphanocladium album]